MVIRDPQLATIAFAIPFWASWFFVFFLILKLFFQRDELLLDRAGAVFVRKVFFPLKARSVPLEELQSFVPYSTVVDSTSGAMSAASKCAALGEPLRLAQGLPGPELEWLVYQLNDHLGVLRGAAREPQSRQPAPEFPRPAASEADDAVAALSLARVPSRLPATAAGPAPTASTISAS